MTIFEEYLESKKEKNRLERDYLWSFYDFSKNMANVLIAKSNLKELNNALTQYDNAKQTTRKIGEKIIELSYLKDAEARYILPKVIKDMTFEDYEFKSLVINNLKRVFLVKRGTLLEDDIALDDLLSSEDVIILASASIKDGFNLYQSIPETEDIGSELNGNLYNDKFIFVKNFIDGYIIAKSEREEISLKDYYLLVCNNIEHGYDEELLGYYDLDDTYLEYDKAEQRREKRRLDAYYHKKKKDAKNQAKAKRKLEQLPDKYMPKENVNSLTFIKRLELMVGRKFSSIEKDTIKSWIILGFDEELIMEAYNEASIRGNYNTSSIAKILDELTYIKRVSSLDNLEKVFAYLTNEQGFTKEDIVGLTKKFPE